MGISTPTPVQEHAIPFVMEGRDAIVQAKTGSGKTLAFGLPILTLIKSRNKPQALVVLPTRELAIQVCEAIATVGKHHPLKTVAIYGGVGLGPQESALRRGVDLVVGTPGRLKDLLSRGSLDLSQVRILILDEADEMLDMGFRRDIEFLLDRLPSREQTLILSATMPEAMELIARKYMNNPAVVKLKAEDTTPSEIAHFFVRVSDDDRMDALIALLEEPATERAIVFTRMKHETKRIALKLEKSAGIKAGFLNGNMSQNARNTMLDRFKSGELRYLIATDVAARGLHVDGLTHVIHYAVPTVVETYIHRSGRTGRAGASGETIIFVTPDAESDFRAICKNVEFSEILGSRLGLPDRTAQDGMGGGARPAARPRGGRPERSDAPRQGGDSASRGRGASDGARRGRSAPAADSQGRSSGERSRPAGDVARSAGDTSRTAAPKPRVAGEPLRSSGQNARPTGEQSRSGGQNARPAGEQARSNGQNARPAGEQARSGGQNARPAGERSRSAGEAPRNEGRGPKPTSQPSPPISRSAPDSMNSTWDRAYPGRQRGN